MTSDQRKLHEKAKTVFSKSLDVPLPERAEFLQRECLGDVNLLQEVESLLSIDDLDLGDDFGILKPYEGVQPGSKSVPSPLKWMTFNLLVITIIGALFTLVAMTLSSRLKKEIQRDLQRTCAINIQAIQVWEKARTREVEQFSTDKRLLGIARELIKLSAASDNPRESLLASDFVSEFYSVSSDYTAAHQGASLHLVSKDGVVLADTNPAYLGTQLSSDAFRYLAPVFDGRSGISPLIQNGTMVEDSPEGIAEFPTHSFTFAPVRNESNRVVGALAAMELAGTGYSEIISQDRQPSDLLVTLVDDEGRIVASSDSAKSKVARPTIHGARSLTKIASSALSMTADDHNAGFVIEPYLNHRGRRVVGAWSWVAGGSPTGVIVERDAASAFWIQDWLNSLLLLGLCMAAAPPAFYAVQTLRRKYSQKGMSVLDQRYHLVELIGQGGYSQVFRARDSRLDRDVAVKVLLRRHSHGISLGRFEREVRILARLTHPSTIRVFDAGQHQEGEAYFVMELVDGMTLAQLVVQHGPQPESVAVPIMQQVSAALSEAHEAGLIHRDIKPQNIMVSNFGSAEQFVKVLDFGLGKNTATPDTENLSSSGEVTGTIQFMAPESVVSPETIMPSADVYSMGAVLFYLLTGESLFPTGNTLQVLNSVVEANWDLNRLPASISPEIADILRVTLAKEPTSRPQNAEGFGEMLTFRINSGFRHTSDR